MIEREDRDTSEFRNYWLYMPQFRVLDQNDFVTTMAVFLVLFIFIALICFAAVIVIAFTRCMTSPSPTHGCTTTCGTWGRRTAICSGP